MTSGNERLDRIERILEQVSNSLQETAGRQDQVTGTLQEMAGRHDKVTSNLQEVNNILRDVAIRQQEMAARQQYHDEAFERHDAEMKRHDAEMKVIREGIDTDAENIRGLLHIELHHRRLKDLEGGGAV